MQQTLDTFSPGQTGRVVRVHTQGALKRRIFDMGITPGTEITMVKAAPMGDPLELSLRGYSLSVRKAEAEAVLMETEAEA